MAKSDFRLALLLALFWSLAEILVQWGRNPGDIQAIFFGGRLFATDAFDLLYADPTTASMAERMSRLVQLGATRPVDPFFYPPLWAWLLGRLSSLTDPIHFSNVIYLAQIPLIPWSALLVARMTETKMRPPAWMAISLLLVTLTLPGHQALYQNQLQILLTFLVLLAFDRAKANQPLPAGIALAVAASIKLLPALFVLLWLIRPNVRAAAAFVGSGVALGLASLAVGGWDLHMAYLARMTEQSAIVIVDRTAWNLGALIYHLTHLGDVVVLDPVQRAADHSYTRIIADWRPLWLSVLMVAALAAAIAALARKAATAPPIWLNTAMLPLFATLLALASPVSWAHSYLPLMLFLPALPQLWPGRRGWLMVIGIATAASGQFNLALNLLPIPLKTGMIVGTLAMVAAAAALALAPGLGRKPQRDQPAQRVPGEQSPG